MSSAVAAIGVPVGAAIVPGYGLGIRTVRINRLGERAQPTPTRELSDLHGPADALYVLVP